MRATFVLRVRLLSACVVLVAVLLIVRLYFIQIVHGDDYRAAALGQYVADSGEMPRRGDILFTSKDGEPKAAAVMQAGWRIAINPKLLENADDAYARLTAITPIEKERFLAAAAKKDDPYEEVAFKLTDDEAEAVRNLKIQGVTPVREEWRLYPAGTLAAHTLGFVAFRGETKAGVYGLERYYEDTLRHDDGGIYINPFAEIFSNVEALVSRDPTAAEGNLVTSLEPSVQGELEKQLDGVVATYSPRLAGGIVMDPQTGEIVAIAARPAFDPNAYNTVSSATTFSNPLIEGRYELGSIMKPLTMAAGIDADAVSPRTTYDDKGCITRTGFKICNFDHKARGVVPMQEVLSQSLNTGATFVAERIGHEKFADYLQKFGFDEETGVDLPGEVPGDISSLFAKGAADVDFASASFGQAIAVTPIEMIRALSALANQGKLPEPHVVRAIRYENGVTRQLTQADEAQVLKPESAEAVTEMLVKVYDEALLKGALKQEHYSIAAKTGTAQLADPVTHKYYTDRYLHSFFGYFPAHDPKFIVFLFAVEPHGVEYASASLANPFSDLAKFLINYYNLPPDR